MVVVACSFLLYSLIQVRSRLLILSFDFLFFLFSIKLQVDDLPVGGSVCVVQNNKGGLGFSVFTTNGIRFGRQLAYGNGLPLFYGEFKSELNMQSLDLCWT